MRLIRLDLANILQKYLDQHAADVTRYNTEFKTVFKRDPYYLTAAAAKA